MTTIFVLLAGAVCYHFIFQYIILDQLDSDLKVEEQEIIDYVKTKIYQKLLHLCFRFQFYKRWRITWFGFIHCRKDMRKIQFYSTVQL